MTLFKGNSVNYSMLAPYVGSRATISLFDGHTYHGEIAEIRRDGILFHSDNPGFLFLPFLAIASLALAVPFAYGAGFASGARYAYGPYPYLY
ncbi:hypothetical protein LPY66_18730 [Dehalobacter sp. DCM]|uniref:hypothetical protein n=1 Tax=Dehalobacter sp. DCM TaxID=2907827 RepID=UPI0030818CCD|nr:hypothetical protein LPY66_18730 [Dehalobacter sp. DCM]